MGLLRLPWAAGSDVEGFYSFVLEPVHDGVGYELRAVVAADVHTRFSKPQLSLIPVVFRIYRGGYVSSRHGLHWLPRSYRH